MPLTVGAVILVVVICLVLGTGNIEKGFARFYIAQWILLVAYLLLLGSVIAYAVYEEIHDHFQRRALRFSRQIDQTHSLKIKIDNGLLIFAGNTGNGVKVDG